MSAIPRPPFPPLVSTVDRHRVFGHFKYTVNRDRTIKFVGNWAKENIVQVQISQLIGVQGAPKSGLIWVNKQVAEQFIRLFEAWEQAGLLPKVLTWAGSFVPRLVRGGNSLSNHAFGTAFDINAAWNGLGKTPAALGKKGSVIELLPIAYEHGFYWGGLFDRPDGMHFEVARVGMLPAPKVSVAYSATSDMSPAEATVGVVAADETPDEPPAPDPVSVTADSAPSVAGPVPGGAPEDPPVQASTGGVKSMLTTLGAQIGAGATGLWAVIKDNQNMLKWVLIIGGAVAGIYILRQTIMDCLRVWVRSKPDRQNAK